MADASRAATERRELLIGVRVTLPADARELFADARAVETAGADSLWFDAADGDPYVALAALAAVTWRIRLVATGAALAAVTWRIRLVATGAARAGGRATCERLARGRLVVAEESHDRWTHAPFPMSRQQWRDVRAAALAADAVGITIPNDTRLIDLLRNPDQEDDRSDLNIAVG